MPTLKATDVEFAVHGEGTGVAQKITTRPGESSSVQHEFSSDEYVALGGDDSAPSPLSYVLGALSACTQMTGKIVADEMGLELGAWTFDVSADLDTQVLVNGGEGHPTFSTVTLDVRVQSDADDDRFEALRTDTERRCPVTALFVRDGLELRSTWSRDPLPGH